MASISELIALAQFEQNKTSGLSSGLQQGFKIRTAQDLQDRAFKQQTMLQAAKAGIPITGAGKIGVVGEEEDKRGFKILNKIATNVQQATRNQIQSKQGAEKQKQLLALGKEFRGSSGFKRFQKVQKSARDITAAYERSKTAADNIAADQALIVGFNKLIDPDSVVRESEFARTPRGQALMRAIKGRIRQVEEGGVGLDPEARFELKVMADELLMGAKNQFKSEVESFGKIVDIIDPVGGRDLVFGGFDDFKEATIEVRDADNFGINTMTREQKMKRLEELKRKRGLL